MGAVIQEGGKFTHPNNIAIAPYLRVTRSAGFLVLAGATEQEFGVIDQRVEATDPVACLVQITYPGTIRMVASEAISAGSTVYGAAGGKVSDTANSHAIGYALTAASGDGSYLEVLTNIFLDQDQVAAIDGNIVFDDDFLDFYPAAATALDAVGGTSWTKVETLGLGVVPSAEANGVLKFIFDAVAEAATADLHQATNSWDIDNAPIFEARVAVFDIGDDAALDINIGMASGTHATDFETIAEYAAFHLNGASLALLAHSDDGTTDTAEVATTITLVDNTYANLKIDFTDKADVKFYVNDVRVAAATAFDMSAYTGLLTPIVHVEKTSNDTTADVRVDRIRVQCQRT